MSENRIMKIKPNIFERLFLSLICGKTGKHVLSELARQKHEAT
jgi:hypothetical protein